LAIWFTARRRGNVDRGCFVSAGTDIANDLLALVHKESLFQFCPTLLRAANSVGMSPLGAHFNPAVTLIFAARGATQWRDMLPYIHRAMRRRRRRRASVHTTFAGIAINHVPGFIIAQLIGATCAPLV
jgi:hypothetical protein